MGFAETLGRRGAPPLVYEPLPPPRATGRAEIQDHLERLGAALEALPDLVAVNVPQIVGGSFETVDARDYALALQETTGHDALVNKIVALTPAEELADWVTESRDLGIRHLILVGGESSAIDYPGPSVTAANRLVRGHDAAPDTIGNICIPFRRRPGSDEPDRMCAKTAAGADHFTSQIVLEPVTTRRLLRDYERACRHSGIGPATVFVGLAPVTEPRDLELLKHLGVEVPPHIERELLWDLEALPMRSLELNLGILRSILTSLREENISVPLGLNVEQVSLHNFEASVELAREASLLLDEHHWLMADADGGDRRRTAVSRGYA